MNKKQKFFKEWPEPIEPEPEIELLAEWMDEDGVCEATDGCWVEHDSVYSHGYPSWFLYLGVI